MIFQEFKVFKNLNYFAIKQPFQNDMYIERNLNIRISENIADTKWISALYLIFKSGVKLKARKMGFCEKKEGKSIGSDSPY